MPLFRPPTYEQAMGPITGLFRFFKFTRGVTVWVTDGVVSEARYPWHGDLLEADYVYLAGHDHIITSDEATVLTAAGYGAYIT